jgi:hypothetical protein
MNRYLSRPCVATEVLVGHDKLRWVEIGSKIAREHTSVHAHTDVLADLKVQMSGIPSVSGSDRSEAFSALQPLTFSNENPMQVPVKTVHESDVAALRIGVPNDHDIAPASSKISRINNYAVCAGINWIAQIRIPTSDPIPILAQMTIGPVAAGLIVAFPVIDSHRQAEAVSHSN